MPRTAIAVETPVGPYPVLPVTAGAAVLTETAADIVNLNSAPFGSANRLLVIVRNTDAGGVTVTFTSRADDLNRTGDITTYAIAAGAIAGFTFERKGWRQNDGSLYFEASDADVKFIVLAI